MKTQSETNIENAFSEIITEAYNNGYDMTVDEDLNITIRFCDKKDEKNMPEISVVTKQHTSNAWVFFPSLTFPRLDYTDDMYSDTIQYYLERWEKVGKLIRSIIDFRYVKGEDDE